MRRFDVNPEDLARCEALLRAGSKSFAMASHLLPRPVRDRATVLYAFCRVTDDEVDDDPEASMLTIDRLRDRLAKAYDGRPEDRAVDRALAALLADTPIPKALPDALFEGMEWDIRGRRYGSLEDLEAYAARVAGTVGAMMTLLMDRRDPSVLARACDLGVAMQLTNVARDVGDDARLGRVYLPLRWLAEAGVDVDVWLASPEPLPAIRRLVARLLAEADVLYRRADRGIAHLPAGCRVAIRAARLVYSDIGRSIARAEYDSVTRRAVVTKRRKLWLAGRALGARTWSPPAIDTPPLAATRELVAACAS